MRSDLVLAGIPGGLRRPLLNAFKAIVNNYRERRWEPAELNGGKLCEVTYSILRGVVDGRFPASPSKPRNMLDACRQLEAADPNRFNRSIRIQIPRVLVALYELRNNRNVGHVGGDVDPSEMDATLVMSTAQWIMAELVRVFHGVSTEEATTAVEALIERTLPIVWEVDGVRRVLVPGMSMRDKTLTLLYSESDAVSESYLIRCVEHSNPTVFRNSVLIPAHRARLLEYNRESRTVRLSPLGARTLEALGRLRI